MLDADAAGQKAVRRASEILEKTGLAVRVVAIPDGKDPDEFIKKNGKERFAALLEGAVSDMEYKLLTAANGINLDAEDGRLKYLAAAAEIIAASDDVMARDIYIGRLSEKYGVSRAALTTRVDELRSRNYRQQRKKEITEVIRPRFSRDDVNPERRKSVKGTAAEETLLAVLLKNPDFCSAAREQLPPDKMLTSLNRRIYEIILSVTEHGGEPTVSSFAESLLPAEIGYLVSLQNSEKADKNPEIVLKDCIRVILEEEMLLSSEADGTVEGWAAELRQLIDKKSKGK